MILQKIVYLPDIANNISLTLTSFIIQNCPNS